MLGVRALLDLAELKRVVMGNRNPRNSKVRTMMKIMKKKKRKMTKMTTTKMTGEKVVAVVAVAAAAAAAVAAKRQTPGCSKNGPSTRTANHAARLVVLGA
jgi:hypothetical protein